MYASVQDMIDRFGEVVVIELTDDEHTGVVDTVVAERALTDASSEIDGYLAAYSLPLAEPQPLLSLLCTDIARYRLQSTVSTEEARQRYEDAVRKLEKIASGQIKLKISSPSAPSSEPVVVSSSKRTFDDDSMRGF
ncbi:MAG: phage protein Gp36 family protein [Pseudohongiellaceae bacterium]